MHFKHLTIFLAQNGYCVGKWEILGIVDGGLIVTPKLF